MATDTTLPHGVVLIAYVRPTSDPRAIMRDWFLVCYGGCCIQCDWTQIKSGMCSPCAIYVFDVTPSPNRKRLRPLSNMFHNLLVAPTTQIRTAFRFFVFSLYAVTKMPAASNNKMHTAIRLRPTTSSPHTMTPRVMHRWVVDPWLVLVWHWLWRWFRLVLWCDKTCECHPLRPTPPRPTPPHHQYVLGECMGHVIL